MGAHTNYYEEQLNKIDFKGEYPATVKFSSEKDSAKWLSINKESAEAIINKLKKEFNIK